MLFELVQEPIPLVCCGRPCILISVAYVGVGLTPSFIKAVGRDGRLCLAGLGCQPGGIFGIPSDSEKLEEVGERVRWGEGVFPGVGGQGI